jgi:flagellar biosynthetic protein FliR
MFIIGFKIAAPIVLAVLITDIGLGILTKTMPQLNMFVVGIPIKIIMGLLIMAITVPAFIGIMEVLKQGVYQDTFKVIEDMIPK